MSLDVYLEGPEEIRIHECPDCATEHSYVHRPVLYEANITHNLIEMAHAAGCYFALWRPEEVGARYASELAHCLRDGLATLLADPERFKAMNAPSGWGTYDNLVRFVAAYLGACIAHPEATVRVSR